ncbi:helix-turn-helix domain-containing protein [Raoultibacter phocaeensis]|uniref:helix-turn-helix domain-containing protein n=1 Tax=Raoultibacter phocaeensis TaxID=2479841 RepID=UPI0015D5856D|nr:helix-turn-helix transcriptional regulator [Raoultibacter phocaeensis]
MLVLIVLDYRFAYSDRTVNAFVIGAAVMQLAGSALLFAPYYIGHFDSQAGAVFGAVFRGAGSAVLLLSLGRLLCSIEPKRSALIIAGGYTVFGVASLALSFAPRDVIAFAALVFPLASGFCLVWSSEKVIIPVDEARPVDGPMLRKIPLDTVVLLFLCALAGVVSGALTPPSLIDQRAFNVFWMVIYCAVFIVYCIWVFRFKRNDPDALWPFLVLVIFSGLFFYSSFSAINSELATSFMSATRRTLMLFCWVFMAASIYRQKLPVLLFFGAGNLVFSQLPAMIGYLIGIFHPTLDSYETSLINVAISAVMALVLVVAIIVVVMRARGSQAPLPDQTGPTDTTKRAIAAIAEQYALSPRESEIALLVVKGYTLPMIGEKLFISTDTVRSHSKGLYKKLGIHKKQELIALVERQA